MTTATFILKNATRNRRRATLSILSVAVSLFLLVALLVTLREITLPPEDVGAALRVAVRNKISIANLLPAKQLPIIERIPGVEAVSPFTWFGGKYKNEESMTFAQFAMDAKKLRAVFGEAKMAEDQYVAFETVKDSCIIGKVTAEKYKLKLGDRITLESSVYPCTLDFKIVGIYAGTSDDRNMLFHQEYLDESCGNEGWVGMWWLRVRSPDEMPRVIAAINKAFENTSAEVRAESERAFQLSFISMLGNVRVLIGSISGVVVFTLILVSASTMSMAVRERFRELAILKAIGFRRRELFAFILAESFGLASAGLLVGAGGAWLLFTHGKIAAIVCFGSAGYLTAYGVWRVFQSRPKAKFGKVIQAMILPRYWWPEEIADFPIAVLRHQSWKLFWLLKATLVLATLTVGLGWMIWTHPDVSKMTNGFFVTFEVTPKIIAIAGIVAAALGIIASIAPAISVARMSVVSGLKTLD
ncbi:MAG TPA: ABC transporter permease [Candidatus Paceibacterota bacterium]|nr:ABC transporter permease [Candidatus Paceibacterota bacterium]